MWSVDWRRKRIILIILIIIPYHFYTGYLPLFTCNSHVSRMYSVAIILHLIFTLHVTLFAILKMLYFYIITIIIFVIPLCRVFTIIDLKNTAFLGYIVLQISVFTICAACNVISQVKYVLYFYISTSRNMCAVSSMAVFVVPWFRAFPLSLSYSVWVILRWFHSPLLLLVSHLS
jgi:hypothetical protein